MTEWCTGLGTGHAAALPVAFGCQMGAGQQGLVGLGWAWGPGQWVGCEGAGLRAVGKNEDHSLNGVRGSAASRCSGSSCCCTCCGFHGIRGVCDCGGTACTLVACEWASLLIGTNGCSNGSSERFHFCMAIAHHMPVDPHPHPHPYPRPHPHIVDVDHRTQAPRG